VPSDHLSDVLDLMDVRATLSGALAVNGRWTTRAATCNPLKIIGVLRGRVTLRTNDTPPVDLEDGDVAVLNGRSWIELYSREGEGPIREITPPQGYARHLTPDDSQVDIVVGGHVDFDETGRAVLAQTLPALGHLRGALPQANTMRHGLRLLLEESTSGDAGSAFALRRHSQLLLLEALRTWTPAAELPPGWLRVLSDDQLRPALAAIHSDPSGRWTLDDLARSAHMSRTSFAERFRSTAGIPPHAYLTRWRMMLAQRALRQSDAPVGSLAARLGYRSESAFSNAFKREVGQSPQSYRVRTDQLARQGEQPAVLPAALPSPL
jgi:AraC-like DNA-binding protein